MRRIARLLALNALLVFVAIGCGGKPQLMPTPNLYAQSHEAPFPNVPPELQNNRMEVLYLTDRAPEEATPKGQAYGHKRSRSIAIGVCEVEIGKDVSWNDLVKASSSRNRSVSLEMDVVRTTELYRFPPTPRSLIPPMASPASAPLEAADPEKFSVESRQAIERGHQELSARLAKTPVKDVYIFVHGVKTGFEGSVTTIAELWHFLGRQGVPIAYSWPAGGKGLLRGYNYDYNSSEFTVYHFKQALEAIASCPDVERIHVIAHSRGTDVVVSALRELHLAMSAAGKSTRDELKLSTVVLAAPDLDVDVTFQRAATARLAQIPEKTTIYMCEEDKALGFSRWLFRGLRLGKLQPEMFSKEELEALRQRKNLAFVDARITKPGSFGHNYFYSNPAVSSDLILLLRYGRLAGAEHGRPLRIEENGFWMIDDDYPTMDTPEHEE